MKEFEKRWEGPGNTRFNNITKHGTAKAFWKEALEWILSTHDETDNWGNVASDILKELNDE